MTSQDMNSVIWSSPNALQVLDDKHVGGTLMPFDILNKYGFMATKDTDFAIEVFKSKPLLLLHMLDGVLESHGEFIQDSFEAKDEGLFGISTASPKMIDFINNWPTGFSLGSMPHLVKFDGDILTQWVIVEGSIGHVADLANWAGTTEAIVQAANPDHKYPAPTSERGIIIMLPNTETTPPADPEPVEATQSAISEPHESMTQIATALDTIGGQLKSINQRVETIEQAPTRQLPPSPPEPPERVPIPQILVASEWDRRSLFGMLFQDAFKHAMDNAKAGTYVRQEDWYKALFTKIAAAWDKYKDNMPEELELGVHTIPKRMISQQCYDVIHPFMPYLQADEVMRTGFTNFGAELLPTIMNSVFYHHFRSASKVWGNLDTFQATSYPTYEWPVITGGPTVRRVLEPEDDSQMAHGSSPIPSSKMGTDKVTFTAGGIGARTLVTAQQIKGAAGDLMDAMAMEYALQMAEDIDWILMNGDKTATAANISHGVDPTNTVWDLVLVINGLRYMVIVTTTTDSVAHATIATTSSPVIRALMGYRGMIGDDLEILVIFVCPEVGRKWDALTDYDSIADVGAALSQLLHGTVGFWKGVPIVSTPAIELGDSDGKYAGTDVTKPHTGGTVGQFVIVHRGIVKVAQFQELQLLIDFIKHSRTFELSSTVELDIQQLEVGGVAAGYNTTV